MLLRFLTFPCLAAVMAAAWIAAARGQTATNAPAAPSTNAPITAPGAGKQEKQPSAEGVAALKKAADVAGKGDVKGAVQILDAALAKEELFTGYYLRGRFKHLLGDFTGALADADKAIAMRRTLRALDLRGHILLDLKRFRESQQCFELALALQERSGNKMLDPSCLQGLGIAVYCQGGNDQLALEYFQQAMEIESVPKERLYNALYSWSVCARASSVSRAKEMLTEAVAKARSTQSEEASAPSDTASTAWPVIIGEFLLSEKELPARLLEKAQAAKDEKTRKDQLCEANYYIAMKYLDFGVEDLAKKHLQAAVDTQALDLVEHKLATAELEMLFSPVAPLREPAHLHMGQRPNDDAAPLTEEVKAELSKAAEASGAHRHAEAIKILDAVLARGDNYFAVYSRAWTRWHQEDVDGALKDADKAVAMRQSVRALCMQGRFLLAKGRYKEGLESYSRAMAIQELAKASLPDQRSLLGAAEALYCAGDVESANRAIHYLNLAKRYAIAEDRLHATHVIWCLYARNRLGNRAKSLLEATLAHAGPTLRTDEAMQGKQFRNPWLIVVAEFILNPEMKPERLTDAAKEETDLRLRKHLLCKMYYYIAMRYRNELKDEMAEKNLRLAIDTQALTATEYTLAQAELAVIAKERDESAKAK
ncbi:hypothetical protein DB346_01760 [Verrucomicrobia bacterium LW23]|nr:hypothetical protein DB346_01760 [Verrucomicrobia bacterium LW23]